MKLNITKEIETKYNIGDIVICCNSDSQFIGRIIDIEYDDSISYSDDQMKVLYSISFLSKVTDSGLFYDKIRQNKITAALTKEDIEEIDILIDKTENLI